MKNNHLYLSLASMAMITILGASNYLVEIPINDWLTYGAFTYPFTFWVSELTNFHFGPKNARRVVYVGFIFSIVLTFSLLNQRIAIASCLAFLVSQLLDVSVFNRLRRQKWWIAPITASVFACTVDTFTFFYFAFEESNWLPLALGDLGVKLLMDLFLLLPFRLMLWRQPLQESFLANR